MAGNPDGPGMPWGPDSIAETCSMATPVAFNYRDLFYPVDGNRNILIRFTENDQNRILTALDGKDLVAINNNLKHLVFNNKNFAHIAAAASMVAGPYCRKTASPAGE